MRLIKIKNNQDVTDTYLGMEVGAGQYHTLDEFDIAKLLTEQSQKLFAHINPYVQDPVKAIVNDGENDLGYIEGKALLDGFVTQDVHITEQPTPPAFASKTLPTGEKLFRRKYGFAIETIAAGESKEIELTAPFNCKINEIELVNCNSGDKIDLTVHDSVDSIYQTMIGVPEGSRVSKLLLNQFGFQCRLCDGLYKDKSNYDADLIGGMIVKLKYYNETAGTINLYGNMTYHQVV